MLGVLEYHAYLVPGGFDLFAFAGKGLAVHNNLSGGRLEQAVQMLNESGFAAAGVTGDSGEGAFLDGEAHIVQCLALKGCAGHICVAYIFYFY